MEFNIELLYNTPLIIAILQNNFEIAKILISKVSVDIEHTSI